MATFRVTARQRMTIREAFTLSPFEEFKYERRTYEIEAGSEMSVRDLWAKAKSLKIPAVDEFELETISRLNPL